MNFEAKKIRLYSLYFLWEHFELQLFLFQQSALRYSNQNELLELEYSDDSSDSEDEIPRDQVLPWSEVTWLLT